MANSSRYRFGPFQLLQEDRLLLCDEKPVALPPRCLELLLIFVQNPRRPLSAESLQGRMWHPEVGQGSLYYTVYTLRKKLRKCSPDQDYIQTLGSRGYQFVADVEHDPGADPAPPQIAESPDASPFQPAPHQLPVPVADFVGRKKQVETLLGALRNKGRRAIIGISGMGGVGKTQLALLAASRLRGDYPDAQLFVELRGAGPDPLSPAEALAECVRAIRPDIRMPEGETELGRLYRSLLYERQALVVLDDAADGRQVLPLLPPHGSAVIITSRNRLAVPGMLALTLDQLSPEESRELVMSLAPHVTPEIAGQICSRCGHLPLAVRAAAGLLSVTPDLEPSEYMSKLEEERARLELLKSEITNIDVEASLGLSYARLKPAAARVLNRLAVFTSTFDARAEEAVCEDDGHAHLTDLVRRSLVIYDGTSKRYRLHDLVRLLAKKYMGADEARRAGRRHAEYYEGVLRQANSLFDQGGSAMAEGLALADLEWGNIQAGQSWAETWAGTDRAAAELCNAYPSAGVSLLSIRLHPREHIAWREAALAAARRLRNRNAEGKHRGYLAEAYRRLGDTRRAMDYHRQSLRIAREMKDREAEGVALGGIGNVYDNMGEFRRALESHKKARHIAREVGRRRREGGALGNMGIAYWRLGNLEEALKCHDEHLAIAREVGDRLGEGYALGNLGLVCLDLGQHRRSIELNSEALRLFREIGDRRSEGDAMGNIGRAYAALGEIQQAISFYKQQQAIAHKMANLELEAEALNNLGAAYAALKNESRAITLNEQALAIARKIGNRRIEANILNDMSGAFIELNKKARAISYAEKALEIYEQIKDPHAAQVRVRLDEWRKGRGRRRAR